MAHHLFQLGVGEFIGTLRPVDGNGCHGAGVDQLLDAGALRGIQKIFCSADVRIVNVLLALGPQAVIRGDVKNTLDALHRASERSGVAQISGHILERQIRYRAIGARRAKKHPHFVTASHQLAGHVAAQEPRRSRDECGHTTLTLSPFACASCSMWTPVSSTLRVAFRWPLTKSSTNHEKNSHHLLPISFRASAVFRRKVAAYKLVEFDPPFAGVITIPSSVRASGINSAISPSSVSA